MKKISGIVVVLFLCLMYPLVAQADPATQFFMHTIRSMVGNGTGFCWFCPIFETLFNAMNTIATTISRDLSQTFLALMGVGLLFSIAFKTAKMLTSLQAVDLMQYLTDMFRHLGRAIIASAFLWASLSIFTYVVSPFLTMSLSLSTTIIEAGDIRATITQATQEINNKGAGINTASICAAADDNAFPLLKAEAAALDNGEAPQLAFAPSVLAAMICLMRTVSASLISGMVVGATLHFGGIAVLISSIMQIGTAFKMLLIGDLILAGHIFIFAAVPFKYIDAMVRMAFVCALMPLWIILWVFPATAGYTKKAWDMFLSTCAIFLCMSVILVLVIQLINAAFGVGRDNVLPDVVRYLVADQAKQAAEVFNVSLKNLLVTIIMCFTGYKMLGTATTLASSFIGSIPNLGVGDQMAKSTVQVAHGAKTAAVATGAATRTGLNKVGAVFGNPNLGNQVATSVGKFAGHTAAAIATGGLSAPISVGMIVSDLLKGRKRAGGGPAPERPTFGKGGSTMGIQAHDMNLISEGKNKDDDIVKTYKDGAGNTVTQTYDKNNPKNLKKELFEDAKGRQLEKNYKDGQLQSEQTKYSDKATQKTKDADEKSGAFKEETKEYEYKTEGGKEIETVTTKDAAKRIVETQETTTEKDEKGNFKHQECVVKDADNNLLRLKATRFDEQGRERHIAEIDKKDGKNRTTEIEYEDGKIVQTHTDYKDGAVSTSTNVITFESNTNGEKIKTSKLYEGNNTSDTGKLLEQTKETSKNERVTGIEKKDFKNKKETIIKYKENSRREEQDYEIGADGERKKIGEKREYQNEILVRVETK